MVLPCIVRSFTCFCSLWDEFPVSLRIKSFMWVKKKEKKRLFC